MVQKLGGAQLWIWLGTGNHQRFIPAHDIARSLGPLKSKCLPVFHAYTGCDTVSFWRGISKKNAWSVWQTFNDATSALVEMIDKKEVSDESLANLERFTVLTYDRTSNVETVNEMRKVLFAQKNRQIENIPSSRPALEQHILRTIYQRACVWRETTECI